jgi:tetratricopeptide (TPR) repeat protein
MAKSMRELEERAQKFARRGQIGRAIGEYRNLVSLKPRDVRLRHKLGELFAQYGDYDSAVDNFLPVASKLTKKGFVNRAIPVYKRILEMDPEHLEARMQLAELFRQEGYEKEAVSHLCLALVPLKKQGNERTLQKVMDRLIELRPADKGIRRQLSGFLIETGRLQDAAQLLAQCALALYKSGQTKEFVEAAGQALELDVSNVALLNALARVLLEQNDVKTALQRLDQALKLQPNCVESLWLLARAFDLLGKTNKVAMVGRLLKEICDDRGDPTCIRKIAERVNQLVEDSSPVLVRPDALSLAPPPTTPKKDILAVKPAKPKKKTQSIHDLPTRVVHMHLGMLDTNDDIPEISANEVEMLSEDDAEEVSGVYSA